MNVQKIYVDDLYIDDEITYTETEINDMFRIHEEAISRKNEFKKWCKEYLK